MNKLEWLIREDIEKLQDYKVLQIVDTREIRVNEEDANREDISYLDYNKHYVRQYLCLLERVQHGRIKCI